MVGSGHRYFRLGARRRAPVRRPGFSPSVRWQRFGFMGRHYLRDPFQNPPPAAARTFSCPARVRTVVVYFPRWASSTVAAFPVASTAPQPVPHDDCESRDAGPSTDVGQHFRIVRPPDVPELLLTLPVRRRCMPSRAQWIGGVRNPNYHERIHEVISIWLAQERRDGETLITASRVGAHRTA